MIDRPHWLHPGDPHALVWTPTCPANRGEVYIARRFPAAPRGVPRVRVLFARHSYNNPVKYVDPSGHRVCVTVSGDCDSPNRTGRTPSFEDLYSAVKFTGSWHDHDRTQAELAIRWISYYLSEYMEVAPSEAFLSIFGEVELEFDTEHAGSFRDPESGAVSAYHCRRTAGVGITCYANSANSITYRLMTHEFAHVFNAVIANNGERQPYDDLRYEWLINPGFPRRADNMHGFAGTFRADNMGWQFSREETAGEEFADMFVGAVYSRWAGDNAGIARSAWMTTNMAEWVARASIP